MNDLWSLIDGGDENIEEIDKRLQKWIEEMPLNLANSLMDRRFNPDDRMED